MNASETEIRRYWQLIKLLPSGNCQRKPLPIVQSFIQSILTTHNDPTSSSSSFNDPPLQTILLNQYSDPVTQTQTFAELSLRCCISHGIHSTCLSLYRQFGESRSFRPSDLFRFVLDDQGSTHPSPSRLSLGQDILKTYDRQAASNLLSWTALRVKRHAPLNKFLMQQGIYRLTDWAILNDTKTHQIHDILGQFYSHSAADVDQAIQLLKQYHAVYKAARLLQQQNSGKVTRCSQPSEAQLLAICPNQTIEQTLDQLQTLATHLRHYRIFTRGGPPPPGLVMPETWEDGTTLEIPSDKLEANSIEPEQTQFLNLYDQAAQANLDVAIAQTIEQRCKRLSSKRHPRHRLFLPALQRFYCQGESMTVIAKTLEGFNGAQGNVSKLLDLKALRADIRHYWLKGLQQEISQIAADYVSAQQLESLDQKLKEALEETLNAIIQNEQQNSKSPNRSFKDISRNLLSSRLCHYLKNSPEVVSKRL